MEGPPGQSFIWGGTGPLAPCKAATVSYKTAVIMYKCLYDLAPAYWQLLHIDVI